MGLAAKEPVSRHMEVAVRLHAGHRLHVGHDLPLEAGDAAGLNEAEDGNQQCAAPDEDELQNLVEDGGAQAAESDVDGNRNGRDKDAEAGYPNRGPPS